jgi:hypothetical protein
VQSHNDATRSNVIQCVKAWGGGTWKWKGGGDGGACNVRAEEAEQEAGGKTRAGVALLQRRVAAVCGTLAALVGSSPAVPSMHFTVRCGAGGWCGTYGGLYGCRLQVAGAPTRVPGRSVCGTRHHRHRHIGAALAAAAVLRTHI